MVGSPASVTEPDWGAANTQRLLLWRTQVIHVFHGLCRGNVQVMTTPRVWEAADRCSSFRKWVTFTRQLLLLMGFFLSHKNNNNASLLLNLSLLSVRHIKIGETGIKTFFCIQVKEYKIGNMVMPPHEQMWTEKKVLYTYNDGADSQRFFASS